LPELRDQSGADRDAAIKRDVEALLFASGRPLSVKALLQALPAEGATAEEVEQALAELAAEFPVDGTRGFELARVAEGWAFRTNRAAADALSLLFSLSDEQRLSAAALETLAIVAYLQPVTRPQIAEIRGVSADSAVQTLTERDLLREVGRAEGAGAAILYGTTERFQLMFGLDGLEELPPLEGFAPGETEREELLRRLTLTMTD